MKRSGKNKRCWDKNINWVKKVFFYCIAEPVLIFILLSTSLYTYFAFSYEVLALAFLIGVLSLFIKKSKAIIPLIMAIILYGIMYFLFPLIINIETTSHIETFYVWKKRNSYLVVYGNANKYVYWSNKTVLRQGDVFTADYTFSKIHTPLNQSSFSFKNFLYSRNIFRTVELTNIRIKNNVKLASGYIQDYLKTINNYNAREFFGTILFNISEEKSLINITKDLGLLHIIIISGFHVHLFIIGVQKFLRKWCKNIIVQYILPIFIALIISFILNFSISTIRVVLFIIVGWVFNKVKDKNRKSNLIFAFAGVMHIFIFPALVLSPTFLLSYGVTYFLMVFNNNYKYKGKKIWTWLKKYLMIIVIANIITMPILINMNYEINIITVFIQICLSPFILMLFPLLFICVFINDSFVFIGKLYVITVAFLNIVDNVSIRLIFGKLSPLLFFLSLFSGQLLINGIIKKEKTWILGLTVHLILFWIILYYRNYLDFFYHIEFINVGSGLSILIRLPNNKGNFLFDAPAKSNLTIREVIPFIKSRNIKNIETIFISHDDNDHSGGEGEIQKKFVVKKVYYNTDHFYELEFSKNFSITNLNSNYNQMWSDNNKSLTLNIRYKKIDFLFTGDIEGIVEKKLCQTPRTFEIVQIPHHGSDTSSSKCFVDSINTKFAVSSNSKQYGFPKKEIIQRWKNSGAIVYSTLWNKEISFAYSNIFNYKYVNNSLSFFH